MEKYGLEGRTIRWVHSWLNSCTLRALINAWMSTNREVPVVFVQVCLADNMLSHYPGFHLLKGLLRSVASVHSKSQNLNSSFQWKSISQWWSGLLRMESSQWSWWAWNCCGHSHRHNCCGLGWDLVQNLEELLEQRILLIRQRTEKLVESVLR